MLVNVLRVALAAIGLLILAALSAAPASAADCPYSANAVGLSEGQKLSCTCRPLDQYPKGIYGTARYTSDSDVCTAAVHAGVIPRTGGDVTVYGGAGCQSYVTTANSGITSRAYGSYQKSIAFVFPIPPCPEIAEANSANARLIAQCKARGQSDGYCACEAKTLTEKLGAKGVYLLAGIHSELMKNQTVDALAAALGDLAKDSGVAVESLPGIKRDVLAVQADLPATCGK